MKRYEGVKNHYTELINHREDLNRGIKILDEELLRIEGELRLLEDLARADHQSCQDQKIIKK